MLWFYDPNRCVKLHVKEKSEINFTEEMISDRLPVQFGFSKFTALCNLILH